MEEYREFLEQGERKEAIRPAEDDFDNFMRKVDIVEDVLKRLGSDDRKVRELAMKEADTLLKGKLDDIEEDDVQIMKNRTIINQKAFDNFNEKSSTNPAEMHPNEFMRQVEADAKQRAEDRRIRKIESDRHKTEGNKAFRNQKYEKALACYDKAIEALKDSSILYCNRSLTYLKIGLSEKALIDADMALKVNDKSLRGFVYKAQALWQLRREEDSNKVIEEAKKTLPDQEDYLNGVFEEWQAASKENGEVENDV